MSAIFGTEGFSGRSIQKLANNLRQRALAEDILEIDVNIIDSVLDQMIKTVDRQKKFKSI